MTKKLTGKQERFVQEYLIDLNASQAAIRAGYSKDTATQMGYENLTKPYIQDAVQKAKEVIAKRNEFSQDLARQMYMTAYKVAKNDANPSAMNGSTGGLCKLYGVNEPDKILQIDEQPMVLHFHAAEAKGEIKITKGED